VTQSWFAILNTLANQKVSIDWLNQIPAQFQLLSKLCQLANQTITNSIHQLMKQSLITLNLLTKSEVDNQMTIILNEFFQSTLLHFGLVVDILRLLTQVDQPFMGIAGNSLVAFETNIYGNRITNLTNGQQSVQVCVFFSFNKQINIFLYFLSSNSFLPVLKISIQHLSNVFVQPILIVKVQLLFMISHIRPRLLILTVLAILYPVLFKVVQ